MHAIGSRSLWQKLDRIEVSTILIGYRSPLKLRDEPCFIEVGDLLPGPTFSVDDIRYKEIDRLAEASTIR